jgi:GT2 family glycosyltransferase
MNLSVVIPVYNHHVLTRQCLEAILAGQPEASELDIVIVDDGSEPPVSEALEGFSAHMRVVRHTHNTGFAAACNDGAAASTAEFLVFLNNDTLPRPGWLEALVDYAQAHPAAAVVGGKLLFPNETIQHAGVVICQDRYPRHIYAGFPADHPAVNRARRYQIVTAACALFRREAFESVGGFDTNFANGYEDVDLCLRLGQLGREVHYCPDSVVYHLESITRGDVPDSINHNDRLYRERWAERVKPDDVQYYLDDELLEFTFEPGEGFPAHVRISPLLGLLDRDHDRELERLLNARARQVFELIKENIRLSTLLLEAGSATSVRD